jgi:FtsP/CotA-like multicopper oxidase with cupredoxin domain
MDLKDTNWMDGVAAVTQCGIPPRRSFSYEFPKDGQRGTFWYHSHLSMQYTDGLFRPIVRIPELFLEDICKWGR